MLFERKTVCSFYVEQCKSVEESPGLDWVKTCPVFHGNVNLTFLRGRDVNAERRNVAVRDVNILGLIPCLLKSV